MIGKLMGDSKVPSLKNVFIVMKLKTKNKTLFFVLVWLLMIGCTSEMDKRVETILAISGPNRSELETVLQHYRHEPQKLKAAKFLIANMRYHHSPYSVRNSQQHPLLDSLTNLADSLLYGLVVENPDSLYSRKGFELVLKFRVSDGEKILEQPTTVLCRAIGMNCMAGVMENGRK